MKMGDTYTSIIFEDFLGGVINADLWESVDVAGAGTTAIENSFAAGALNLCSGGNLNDERQVRYLNQWKHYIVSKNFVFEVRLKAYQNTSYNMYIQMYNGADERIKFEIGTDTASGAVSTTRTGGVSTTNDIAHSHDTNLHKLTVIGRSSSVKFLIDESPKQTHTTHITALWLYPMVGVKTLDATPNARRTIIDYISLQTQRET